MTRIPSCAPATPTTLLGSSRTRARDTPLAIWIRQPWMVRVGTENVLIRGTSPRDLGAVADMHSRCSARSLLDRYRAGGRAPSATAIEASLRQTLAFVACTARGQVIALAGAQADPQHGATSAEVALLVEDAWQGRGVGRELITHLAGAAFVCGYTELIACTATTVQPARRLLSDVGRTYAVLDEPRPHLHTHLTEATTLGLGAIREHLAC